MDDDDVKLSLLDLQNGGTVLSRSTPRIDNVFPELSDALQESQSLSTSAVEEARDTHTEFSSISSWNFITFDNEIKFGEEKTDIESYFDDELLQRNVAHEEV